MYVAHALDRSKDWNTGKVIQNKLWRPSLYSKSISLPIFSTKDMAIVSPKRIPFCLRMLVPSVRASLGGNLFGKHVRNGSAVKRYVDGNQLRNPRDITCSGQKQIDDSTGVFLKNIDVPCVSSAFAQSIELSAYAEFYLEMAAFLASSTIFRTSANNCLAS